jgi:parallel beta-helix repeat protein
MVYHVTTPLDSLPGGADLDGSLRSVINIANKHRDDLRIAGLDDGVPDTIVFDARFLGQAPVRLGLTHPLPDITDYVIIDGTTASDQPDYSGPPLVQLDGSRVGPNANGLSLLGGNSMVLGMVINNFSHDGIYVHSNGNTIQGCYLGTDLSGTLAQPNGQGVELAIARGNTVGGVATGNLISGNGLGIVITAGAENLVQANNIGTQADGVHALPNRTGVVLQGGALGNRIDSNVISGNREDGVVLTDGATAANAVTFNMIGTDTAGLRALGNGGNGVVVAHGTNSNRIEGNVISANGANGIYLFDRTWATRITANMIGTDLTGVVALGNAANGISVDRTPPVARVDNPLDASGVVLDVVRLFVTQIGSKDGGNVISGNRGDGIDVLGDDTEWIVVENNFIGTDASGARALGNAGDGVFVSAPGVNVIGEPISGGSNVISGNRGNGVAIATKLGRRGNAVDNNYIGTNSDGTQAVGNTLAGLYLNVAGTLVLGNVLSGNGTDGLFIAGEGPGVQDAGVPANVVQGNLIGTAADGAGQLGNKQHGVHIVKPARNNRIGGTSDGPGNTIAYNGKDGVLVDGAVNNRITGNSIFSNGNLGIELINGGNNGQRAPVLTSVTNDGDASTTITGTMLGLPGKEYTLEFFASPVRDPSGVCEGQIYLGAIGVRIGVDSDPFQIAFAPAVPLGYFITVTASDLDGNTSAFSVGMRVG